jgi:hypothetical protein
MFCRIGFYLCSERIIELSRGKGIDAFIKLAFIATKCLRTNVEVFISVCDDFQNPNQLNLSIGTDVFLF